MECHFIRLFAFLTIACCLALQPAEATNNNASKIIKSDSNNRVGLGLTTSVYSSDRGLMRSGGFSWRIWTSRRFDLQGLFLTDGETEVWAGNRFLYTNQINSLGKFYFGWGMNYPILQVGTDSNEKTLVGPWVEVLLGFEYFFSNHSDFGYSLEVGVTPLRLKHRSLESQLDARLLLAYHQYF